IVTRGDYAFGISANSSGGGASVTSTGTVTTEGYSAPGIIVRADNGDVGVDAHNVTTLGDRSDGILAISTIGTVSVTQTGLVDTTGTRSRGIYAYTLGGSGGVVVSANDVHTRGDNAVGIGGVSS